MTNEQFFLAIWITQLVQCILIFHCVLKLVYVDNKLRKIHEYVRSNKEIKDLIDNIFEHRKKLVEKIMTDTDDSLVNVEIKDRKE